MKQRYKNVIKYSSVDINLGEEMKILDKLYKGNKFG